jgi:RTX calcium-binding nonapeptide repeat (4 copies)
MFAKPFPISRPRPRTRRALLAAVVGAALLPASAQAGTASVGTAIPGGLISYVAAEGETNNVSVFVQNNRIVIADAAPVRAGTGCVLNAQGDAECPLSAPFITVLLRDKNDTIVYRAPHRASVSTEDGDDVILGGARQSVPGRAIEPVFYFGNDGRDTISYAAADRGVRVDTDDNPGGARTQDGRPGIDLESVGRDVEKIVGSSFSDVLFGSPGNDNITGGRGNDEMGGGAGNDFFFEDQGGPNGADSIHGADGVDRVSYAGRTSNVFVSLDGVRNDGEAGELDDVRPNVENVTAGDGNDTLTGNGVANDLQAFGGNDTLHGLGGNDTLLLGSGNNGGFGGAGNDVISARNGEIDNIDCGDNTDTAIRDSSENFVRGCETSQIGVLRLAPKSVRAAAGGRTQLKLSWERPRSWRELRRVELRLIDDGVPVGEVVIRPHGERVSGDGAVKVLRSRLVHDGRKVSARVALRLDDSVAGRRLVAEVEAVDRRGARQVVKLGG